MGYCATCAETWKRCELRQSQSAALAARYAMAGHHEVFGLCPGAARRRASGLVGARLVVHAGEPKLPRLATKDQTCVEGCVAEALPQRLARTAPHAAARGLTLIWTVFVLALAGGLVWGWCARSRYKERYEARIRRLLARIARRHEPVDSRDRSGVPLAVERRDTPSAVTKPANPARRRDP